MAIRTHEDLAVKEILREFIGLLFAGTFFAAAVAIIFGLICFSLQ
jgi:hypothetical protein